MSNDFVVISFGVRTLKRKERRTAKKTRRADPGAARTKPRIKGDEDEAIDCGNIDF